MNLYDIVVNLIGTPPQDYEYMVYLACVGLMLLFTKWIFSFLLKLFNLDK